MTTSAREKRAGRIIGLVNAVGIGKVVPALETTSALFRQVLEVNLIASFFMAREAAKTMHAHADGSIVNITSVSGIRANAGRVAYGASKGAADFTSRILAVEWANFKIRVHSIACGPI